MSCAHVRQPARPCHDRISDPLSIRNGVAFLLGTPGALWQIHIHGPPRVSISTNLPHASNAMSSQHQSKPASNFSTVLSSLACELWRMLHWDVHQSCHDAEGHARNRWERDKRLQRSTPTLSIIDPKDNGNIMAHLPLAPGALGTHHNPLQPDQQPSSEAHGGAALPLCKGRQVDKSTIFTIGPAHFYLGKSSSGRSSTLNDCSQRLRSTSPTRLLNVSKMPTDYLGIYREIQ